MQSPNPAGRRLAHAAVAGGAGLALALTGLATAGVDAAPASAAGSPSAATPDSGAVAGAAVLRLSQRPLSTNPGVARGRDGRVALGRTKTANVRSQIARQQAQLRQWLRKNAPAVKVTGSVDFAANAVTVALHGTSRKALGKAPGVAAVLPQYSYSPQALASTTAYDDIDLERIDAAQAWAKAGHATSDNTDPSTWAGYGTKVGIVDTGIDTTHPCFADTGYPKSTQVGDTRYTNNKVIAARVFNNKLNQNGFDAEGVGYHGTHVAGTVACDLLTPAKVGQEVIPYAPSGVAPGAQLGSYNVFPGDVENARSEDILEALDAAAADGMDVINMSLGGGYHGRSDILTNAVDNLDRGGIVVAVSNGNDGPGYLTGGSPGSAARALTAGASSVGHYMAIPVYPGKATTGDFVAAVGGDFPVPTDAPLTGPLTATTGGGQSGLSTACDADEALPTAATKDAIVLVSRGICSFAEKVTNAEKAGYAAAIVVNNQVGDPIAMAGSTPDGDTYAVMVGQDDGDTLKALAPGDVTIGNNAAYYESGNDDILADFSSWGPTRVDYRIKPDVTAPGLNVLSSFPHGTCDQDKGYDPAYGCWSFLSGTSMASPHLAGSAAAVIEQHPGWTAAQVRSAIVNTADRDGVVDEAGDPIRDVLQTGSGLENLDNAMSASLLVDPVSVSFGKVSAGAGSTLTRSVRVTNVTGTRVAAAPTLEDQDTPFSVSGPTSVAPGETATYTVTFSMGKANKASALAQNVVSFGSAAHMAVFAYISGGNVPAGGNGPKTGDSVTR